MEFEQAFAFFREWERRKFSPEFEEDEQEYYPDPDEKYDERDINGK